MSAKGKDKGKGKGKGKKGKEKKDPNKLTQVDRAFYELTIADLNKKLARLRSHLTGLDDTNINLTEKLRELEEDRLDVAAHLERTLEARNDTIRELEERLLEITKIRDQENTIAGERIKDLEAKYKAMHDQLTSEIKLLNGKLNSLDEFRVQRDILLAKFDDQEADLKEKDRQHQELLCNMEQKAVVEKDALKKEVEAKLLQVSEDFTRSSEIRNAGYTRRLIRENIALQKEIDTLVLSHIKMQQSFNEQVERHKQMTEQYAALDQMKKQLIRSSQNKLQIIEKLTNNYERLKNKYVEIVKYQKLYETSMKRDMCDRITFNEMSKKLRTLGQRIEGLKEEKNRLLSLHQQHEAEILRLRGIIQQIKLTVEAAIDAINQDMVRSKEPRGVEELSEEDFEAMRKLKRHDLLAELLQIVSSHSDELPETPSVLTLSRSESSLYKPGKMGFLPRTESSMMDIFKFDAHKLATATDMISTDFQLKSEDSKIIPKARILDGYSMVDVELGSTLYVSSSHEDLEIVQVQEEEPIEGEEASSSSDYQSSGSGDAMGGKTGKSAGSIPRAMSKISKRSTQSMLRGTSKSEIDTSRSEANADAADDQNDEDANSINLFY